MWTKLHGEKHVGEGRGRLSKDTRGEKVRLMTHTYFSLLTLKYKKQCKQFSNSTTEKMERKNHIHLFVS